MKRLLVVMLLCHMGALQAAMTFYDDRGRDIILPRPAQRIVSLAPNLTELLFAAGAGSRLVGTTAYSDYPAQARDVPQVGDSAALDIERIVSLKPDLILAWMSGNSPVEIAKLEQLGLRVLAMEPHGLDSIAEQIETLGRISGTEKTAAAAAARFREGVAALRQKYRRRRKVSVFYQVWDAPLMTVNGQQVISEVISLCGGENIFAGLRSLVPKVSLERVLVADPQAIVTASDRSPAQALDNWLRWKQVRAVRNGNLLVIPADDISRPTPRLLSGARLLCRQLDEVRAREVAAP